MDLKKILNTFHPFERRVFPVLKHAHTLEEIMKATGMQEIEVMRALQWLSNKEVIKKEGFINPKTTTFISLTQKAERYQKEKRLPERKILEYLQKHHKATKTILKKELNLEEEEFNAILGILKKENYIHILKNSDIELQITEKGLENKTLSQDEHLFEKICGEGSVQKTSEHSSEFLKRRGLIEEKEKAERIIILTPLGEKLSKEKISNEVLDKLTPEMLKTKAWREKEFRRFDIKVEVPRIYRGKRHFVDQAIQSIKRIWLDLGFKELEGNLVETAFWDLDALFVPQDHSAREMQDTFFVKGKTGILKGDIPEQIAKKIKAVHETGGDTGSAGWGGVWNKEKAKELLLITHDTYLSAKTLAHLKKEDLPFKSFQIMKVFRNEALDWKHLFEFYQVGGIVVDQDVNLRNLLGYLKQFFKKMGYPDVQIRPSFFGYTEPSAEIFVFHPIKKEWVEVGGAGMFRPEVTKPLLGFECPVIAWGIGLERVLTDYYKIKDLREIYKNDLRQLRDMKEFMK
ncbi:phenylalanine--tRNA ligase subunit alpha [Candidatus Woesearchaeota archaeon]|nr:phenylalanine--tRNA ligase subunit alpha [Candidatus Woesearchaeota archaeon]